MARNIEPDVQDCVDAIKKKTCSPMALLTPFRA